MVLIEEVAQMKMSKRKRAEIIGFGLCCAIWLYTGSLLWVVDIQEREIGSLLYRIGIMVIAAIVSTVLHEALHGAFFYKFCGRATFGAKWSKLGPVCYASSPGRAMSRWQFQVTCLAPQLLTIIIIAILWLIPLSMAVAFGLLWAAAFNLGGGCMDIYMTCQLRKYPAHSCFEDTEDGYRVYAPEV